MPNRKTADSEFDGQTELPLFDLPPTSNSSTPTRTFPGWDRSILASVTEYLAAGRQSGGTLDLSDRLVVVPTRNAGRRLRESLALLASETNDAVIPPLVVTQDFITSVERISDDLPAATRHITRLIWSALLLDINPGNYRCIFPVNPVERDLTWAMKTADELLDVRNLLAESGLDFASAAKQLATAEMEPARWAELASLEELATRRTEKLGYRDECQTRLAAATRGEIPAEVSRIVVAATPDLWPISTTALSRLHNTIPVELLIAAPESNAANYDSWGRPLPEYWLSAEIPIPHPEESIREAATATAQAELACELIGDTKDPAVLVAIGVPDPEVTAPLEQAAILRGWTTYDPAGQPVSRHGIYYLIDHTAALLATESFDAVDRLLRCPDFGKALVRHVSGTTGEKVSITRFITDLDKLAQRCLPDRLDDAIAAAQRSYKNNPNPASSTKQNPENPVNPVKTLETGLVWIAEWIRKFQQQPFGSVLSHYLAEIFADRTFSPNEQTHGAFSEVADTILEADDAFAATEAAFPKKIAPAERFQLLLELIRERHLYDEREPRDIDLQGWLELLWEDAPHLVVTGMNDHVVPESIIGHAFLPDSARRTLGVPDNDARFARDAYLLTTLLATRSAPGHRTDLVFGRRSDSGDPLRPSRLLFQCSDADLPQRTLQFFGGAPPSQTPLPWQLPWKLRPQQLPDDHRLFQRLSVTQFRSYLTCPFRFYLQHGLRMEEFEADKTEMDSREFGNLIHDTLERFSRDPEASVSTDPTVINASFEREIDAILAQRYGPRLTTPVLVQREAARHRLAWWSKIEAAERAAGWRLFEIEGDMSEEEQPFAISGMPISGRIDRIEQHEDGRLRVFDFKTHSILPSGAYKPKTVRDFHITHIKRTEDPVSFPEWSRLDGAEGKAERWTDLQIPLYLLALTQRYPGREIQAGHVALGPTENEVVLDIWHDLDRELLDSAGACAEGIIAAIRAHRFWPPSERLPWNDPFEELLFSDPEKAVDPTGLGA